MLDRPLGYRFGGIDVNAPYMDRTTMLEKMEDGLRSNRFIIIVSPPGSGKTSLLQLFQKSLVYPDTSIYVSAAERRCCTWKDLLYEAGIRVDSNVHVPKNGILYLILDDAHLTLSGSKDSWIWLYKSGLPKSVMVIISADHNLCKLDSFEYGWPIYNNEDLVLSDTDAMKFLTSEIELPESMRHHILMHVIIKQCAGQIGALRLSINELCRKFHGSEPTDFETLEFYLSDELVQAIAPRLFGRVHENPLDQESKDVIIKQLLSGSVVFAPTIYNKKEKIMITLGRCGLFVGTHMGSFASPLARRYYYTNWLFPERPKNCDENVNTLVLNAIQRMSTSMLLNSKMRITGVFELTLKHLITIGLAGCIPSYYTFCPIEPQVFPDVQGIKSHLLIVDKSRIKGELDFYTSDRRCDWGIEVNIEESRSPGEQVDRFGPNGKYAALKVTDYVVVNIRQTEDGKPTDVPLKEKHMTVFLKSSDFSSCQCVVGENGDAVRLNLAE
jgi:energy-coupling factor transporter ATP-binding protein EcfA2